MRAASTLANTASLDDTALVGAWLEGDEDAFDALYQRYFPALVRHLRSRAGTAAEDLAQETIIRAMRHIHGHDTSRPLWPWLSRIATNAAIDAARVRARGEAVAQAVAAMPTTDLLAAPADSHLADQDLLRRALGDVPDRQRAALERCYVEGWRPTDIAADFGVGSNAFDQLLHRARRNLRRAYMRHEGEEHAAHLGWLAGLVAPLRGLGGRLRHLGSTMLRLAESAPRLGEGVAASVLAGVVIAGVGGILPSSVPADRPITPRGAVPTLVVPAEAASAVPRPGGAPPAAMTVRPPPAASHTAVAPVAGEEPVDQPVVRPAPPPTGSLPDLLEDEGQPQPPSPLADVASAPMAVELDSPVSDLLPVATEIGQLPITPTPVNTPEVLAPAPAHTPVPLPLDPG